MKRTWRVLALAVMAALVCGMLFACASQPAATDTPSPDVQPTVVPTEEPVVPGGPLPRNETLYFAGLQFGRVVGWNPYSSTMNNSLAIGGLVWEPLYMYNLLDGGMYPLLADGDYQWNDEHTQITVKINPDAMWSDGTPVTADDVAYTYDTCLKYSSSLGLEFKDYIEKIEAPDAATCVIYAKLDDDGLPHNALKVVEYLGRSLIVQKAYTKTLEARTGEDSDAFKSDPCADFVASGPYKSFYDDEQKVVYIRDDNYWGQAASMWGELPAPKYLCHTLYSSNDASQAAFEAGEVDVNQQFLPDIQKLWLEKELPISTYIDEPPYGICVTIPTAWFNLKSYGLDNAAVRKAIAMAVDYDAIIANAMTNQSPTFEDVPRSFMNPTPGEQAMYDHDAVADLQWVGGDIEGAKALLDAEGVVDADGDGFRELGGKKLEYVACCPGGWTDWQAAIEIVAAAGQNIGIDITTNFPTWEVYQTIIPDPNQTECDIFMWNTGGSSATQPWSRLRQLVSSEFLGLQTNWLGNFGGYSNPEIDRIIADVPKETDPAAVKEMYTEAVRIYLTDVPSFALMYRPSQFHAVNESVWTNYPEQGDGLDIPPTCLASGYGIAGLYHIELVNP